jgi:hypothetical protein
MNSRAEPIAETQPAGGAAAVAEPARPLESSRPAKARHGSEKRQRSAAIRVRVSPADQLRLKNDAAAAGMSVAAYLATGRLDPETATRPRVMRRRAPVDVEALMRALVAFNRVHSNLNQFVRAVNTLTLFAEEHGAARLTDLLEDYRRAAESLQDQFAPPVAAILEALRYVREG